ncbi:MAG: PEP-CTERM sorting domain-containing protein [Chlorobaculum sp.]|nr:PEP-CTERM sorting domain-containing protein [Chlorobaculum sp.]
MKNRKHVFFSFAALFASLWSGTANAKIITYNIDVTVKDFVPELSFWIDWSIPFTPTTYQGTFTADDTVAGEISNLNLTIGSVDIASSFSFFDINTFDPGSFKLNYDAIPDFAPAALTFYSDGLAIAEDFDSGLPYWTGTFSITESAVPEPSSVMLLGIGILGAGFINRRNAIAEA